MVCFQEHRDIGQYNRLLKCLGILQKGHLNGVHPSLSANLLFFVVVWAVHTFHCMCVSILALLYCPFSVLVLLHCCLCIVLSVFLSSLLVTLHLMCKGIYKQACTLTI